MPAISEFDLQRAFCIWFKGELRKDGLWKVVPAAMPGVMCWHTPNGGTRRDAFEGQRLKQSGLEPGIHDLLFLASGKLYGMEWKAPGGKLSPSQENMHPRMIAAGLAGSVVVDNLMDARRWTFEQGLSITC